MAHDLARAFAFGGVVLGTVLDWNDCGGEMKYGILKDKTVEPIDVDLSQKDGTENLIKWADWFEKSNRHVASDEQNGVRVSTVFLGLDHGFMSDTPLWFETMIFGGEHDGYQDRYETWSQAEHGHQRALQLAGFVH